MKALSVHGPWAYYERRNADNEARIMQLEQEVLAWKEAAKAAEARLEEAQQHVRHMQGQAMPQLQQERVQAQELVEQLQAQLIVSQKDKSESQTKLLDQVQALTEELGRVNADNAVLRAELAKTVHTKATTNTKLELVRKKLGLTELEAKEFLQELDDARSSNKVLKEENTVLAADKAHLQQQLENRSQHCMTLITDNKRLMGQVSELRMQLQKMDGNLWQAKQELDVQQKQQAARKPVACKEKPQWENVKPSSGKALTRQQSQNCPPWHDAAKPKVVKGQVALSPLAPTDSEPAKAHAVRHALAVRQQRRVSQPQS